MNTVQIQNHLKEIRTKLNLSVDEYIKDYKERVKGGKK